MITISNEDLQALKQGLPPVSEEMIEYLTVSCEWLDLMKSYCLEKVIAAGGSKVKILYGGAATGKSHYLQNLKAYAKRNGFFTVEMNLASLGFPLTDSVSFYKAVARQLDDKLLEETLKAKILDGLGHNLHDFEAYDGLLTDYLCHTENAKPDEAKRTIRKCIHNIVNGLDLEFSFRKYLHKLMEAVVENDVEFVATARQWIKGEKIERSLKTQSQLYEALNKSNARSWLYSLMELVKFMGFRGAVILLDQFEAILPHTASEVNYTTAKRNDVYELLRQLIDDLDFFRNILIVIAGNSDIVENEFQGLQSYQALWLRIQPGFIQHNHLNLYADMIDADTMFKNLCDSGELKEISDKLQQLGLKELVARQNPMLDEAYIRNFRDLIADKAWI